ncbi:hypothetical protein Bca52824_012489 [Brassica carinata]|uniref:KIB1-4 beta-propeller domain-containing protein n=1 Tax=Brassica carinata TaxID=52824 RepID=A0A8X7VX38_BRACI|nr:hypothetical protein Bca52824_012489 [Brassica carinata]
MSHIIVNRLFKPSVSRKFLRLTTVRAFTSDQPNQFLLVDSILKNPNSPDGGLEKEYSSCRKENKIYIHDKKVMKNVCDAMTDGFSREGLKLELTYKGPAIHYKNVSAHLPPLPDGSQVQSLAMSSLPTREKDWVVGVKLSGSRLSLCRPFGSCKWIDVRNAPGSINPMSSLMFSKKDKTFYIPSLGGNYLCYLNEKQEKLEFLDLKFDDLPASVHEEFAKLILCSRTDHLVESPTGQLFLVKWYAEDSELCRYSLKDDENEESTLEHRHTSVRLFTSDQPYRFLLVDYILKNPNSSYGVCRGLSEYSSCREENRIDIYDKNVMKNVCDAMTDGFSREGLKLELTHKGPAIHYKNVSAHLPPLPDGSQVQSLAMSSLPTREKDWVVGVKLSGSRLSLCRPFGSCKWIDVKNAPGSINPMSSLMFSKKDETFYIPSLGGNYLCYLEEKQDKLEFMVLKFDDLPASVYEEVAKLNSFSRTDHLVESPTGQLFLVKWYGEDSQMRWWRKSDKDDVNEMPILNHVTKKFMVFREGEQSDYNDTTMTYTEDIGDLCIFLGHSQAYCVPASSSPGLKPNCIYFVGRNFGVYDLTTKTCTSFYSYEDFNESPLKRIEFPYWPTPVSSLN